MGWRWRDSYHSGRPVRGGIKATSKRGHFGETWWAQGWTTAIVGEDADLSGRLSRGRSCARRGQVLSIRTYPARIEARVQGSSDEPYVVRLILAPLSPPEWDRVIAALSRQTLFAAKLLAGQLPREVEDVFAHEALSLFPDGATGVHPSCSCGEEHQFCQHVVAVACLVGEELDRDPFLLFKLRGMDRETLLARLAGTERTAIAPEPPPVETEPQSPHPQGIDPANFWNGDTVAADLLSGEVAAPPVPAALPRRAGSFPFWRGEDPFLVAMELIYPEASRWTLDFLADQGK